jgi:hypothetical protein
MSDKYIIESVVMTRSHINGSAIRTIVYERINYGDGDMVKIEVKTDKDINLNHMTKELELKDIFHELQNK